MKKSNKKSKIQGQPKKQVEEIDFLVWFQKKVRENRLKFWQELEIKTFFKEKDLKEKEDPKKFDKILELY